jgi:hypothetical protein
VSWYSRPAIAVPRARLLDQPEEREEDDRQDEGDRPEGRDSDLRDPARHLARPRGDVAHVRLQRVERVAPSVDEGAEVAVPDLVDDLRQVVAQLVNGVDDRRHHHEHEGADDDDDPEHEHGGAPLPAPVQRARSIAVTTGESTATLKIATKIRRRTFAIDASAHAMATAPATSRIVRIDIETST